MTMKPRIQLLAVLSAVVLATSAFAEAPLEERSAPDYEYFVTIQRIDLPSRTIYADGQSYHLVPESEIWIDQRPAEQEALNADMNGLPMGIRSYEEGDRRPIRSLHIFTPAHDDGGLPGAR